MPQVDKDMQIQQMLSQIRSAPQSPMPKYKCHKEVWALKIAKIEIIKPTIAELEAILNQDREPSGGIITPEDKGYGPFEVNQEYIRKHNPKVGGYYVVYKDGYKSFSPADAFEEGYTRV